MSKEDICSSIETALKDEREGIDFYERLELKMRESGDDVNADKVMEMKVDESKHWLALRFMRRAINCFVPFSERKP